MPVRTTSFSLDEIQKKLEHYCAYQDRCHQEVELKLRTLGVTGTDAAEIISTLIAGNFLNEERFARSFARGKHRIKGWGRMRIVSELKSRNISPVIISMALQEIADEYDDGFDFHAEKAWNAIKEPNAFKKKMKFCAQMMRKGFEADRIQEKAEELSGV